MDIRQLEILNMLVSQKSFQKAARQCFVSTSTLARQITALETELGFPIFERSAAGITLTEQGRVFYRETRGIPQLYESAVSNARKAKKNQRNIRVAVYGYTRNRITRICEELKAHDESLNFSFVSCRVGESLSALQSTESTSPCLRIFRMRTSVFLRCRFFSVTTRSLYWTGTRLPTEKA